MVKIIKIPKIWRRSKSSRADHLFPPGWQNYPVDFLLPEKSRLEAEVTSKNAVRIEGDLKGRVVCPVLIISLSGKAMAEVETGFLYLEGSFKGIVRTNFLYLSPTAYLEADIWVNSLYVEEGARVKGHTFVPWSFEPANLLTFVKAKREVKQEIHG